MKQVNTILPVGGESSKLEVGEGIKVAVGTPCCVGVIVAGVIVGNKVGVEKLEAEAVGVTVGKPMSPSGVCVVVGTGLGGFCQM